jgi:oligopeptide transport system substrate-binding protein
MRIRGQSQRWVLLLAVLALIAAACGGGGGGAAEGGDSSEGGGDGGGEGLPELEGDVFSVYLSEPEFIAPPANVTESEGRLVVTALFSPLVEYDLETSEPIWGDEVDTAMAADIQSDDQQTWTITLKDGWEFHDGTPVTAQSYVNTWNDAAAHPEYTGQYFFSNIEGFEEMQPPPEEEAPASEGAASEGAASEAAASEASTERPTEMSGLEVVDDLTFRVTLTEPFSQFPLTIGYNAFMALPDSCLEDMEACAEAPIGSGPFQMAGTWAHDEGIHVQKFENWGAGRQAQADGIEFRIYTDINTGYTDLQAGNLDILDTVPPEQIEAAQQEFGDAYMGGNSSSYTYIGLPTFDQRFADPDLRHALSMAIDREAITETIKPEEAPADAMVSPAVAGYREGACGEWCTYDPQRAKELFDQAGGLEGPVTIWFNSGAGHEEWVEAVSNQWRENLGITEINFESLDFAQYLPILQEEEQTGPFRLGWLMDYPSPQNYLENLLYTDASSNYTGWSNEEFDSLIDQGNAAGSIDEGLDFYNQAEDIAIEEMPHIPMFFGSLTGVHSDRVSNVVYDSFEHFNWADIEVAEG